MPNTFAIVAIDGPSGVGKSTLAKQLAKHFDFLFVDSGAMFRCLAWKWRKFDCSQDEAVLTTLGEQTQIELRPNNVIYCDHQDVSEVIRTEEISTLASKISQLPPIRKALKNQQRQIVAATENSAAFKGAVMEGRDIGTVIFPKAHYKFFLSADNRIRAERRFQQLLEKGQTPNFEEVLQALEERDLQDTQRELAPLRKAEDAIEIDTTAMNIEQVLQTMIDAIQK